MTCPNGDPNFNKTLAKMLGREPTVNDRNIIFYTVCILLRLSIASFLLIFRDQSWIPYVFLLGSSLAILNFSQQNLDGPQWWSKRFQFGIAILIFIVALIQIICKNCINTAILPSIFFISIAAGFIQSLIVKKC